MASTTDSKLFSIISAGYDSNHQFTLNELLSPNGELAGAKWSIRPWLDTIEVGRSTAVGGFIVLRVR